MAIRPSHNPRRLWPAAPGTPPLAAARPCLVAAAYPVPSSRSMPQGGTTRQQERNDVLVRDVDHHAGDAVAWVGQDEDPEGPLAAHADGEGGDMLEAAREPHLPQCGLGAGQPLAELPGGAPGLVAGLAEV